MVTSPPLQHLWWLWSTHVEKQNRLMCFRAPKQLQRATCTPPHRSILKCLLQLSFLPSANHQYIHVPWRLGWGPIFASSLIRTLLESLTQLLETIPLEPSISSITQRVSTPLKLQQWSGLTPYSLLKQSQSRLIWLLSILASRKSWPGPRQPLSLARHYTFWTNQFKCLITFKTWLRPDYQWIVASSEFLLLLKLAIRSTFPYLMMDLMLKMGPK